MVQIASRATSRVSAPVISTPFSFLVLSLARPSLRAQAKQSSAPTNSLDCCVACAPRNDGQNGAPQIDIFMMSSYDWITRSRTETSVETATSVSATAVTTSITLALPEAMATVWASDFLPASTTLLTASFNSELNDGPAPPVSAPFPAPSDCCRILARDEYALAATVGEAMGQSFLFRP